MKYNYGIFSKKIGPEKSKIETLQKEIKGLKENIKELRGDLMIPEKKNRQPIKG